MTLRYKWGAGWVIPAAGKVGIKWGGTTWYTPSILRVKIGAAGGGYWHDPGYRGYPSDPVSFGLYSHDYSNVRVQWAAGAGGAPVSSYTVVMNNQANNATVDSWAGTGGVSGNLSVAHSTKYHFYVRSESASGLSSNWVGPIKLAIGKPDASYYTTEQSTRPWSLAASVNGYKDAIVGVGVASHRVVQQVRYQISANGGFTSVLSPYNNREIYRIANSGQQERFSWLAGSVDTTVNVGDYWGNGGITGMICRGAGWATGPATHVARAVGTITASGYETYSYQQYHSVPAVPNAYW